MASNDIRTYTLTFGKVYNNGVECKTPVVTIAGSSNIALNCIDKTACIYKVQVGPDVTDPCFTVLLQCAECDGCGVQEKTYCFCDTIGDCQDCEICGASGFCEQLCSPDHCVGGTCVECGSGDLVCPCNLVCENGGCTCPAGSTYNAETGCCDECNVDSDCETCELCKTIDGHKTCVPKECTTGVCNPDTNECVECNASGDCLGEHECCNTQHECTCCPGYHRVNGVCIMRCQFDTDCDVCEICDPQVGCIPLDCGNAVCNPDTNSCEEPCDGNCPPGKGCLHGFCVDCSTLSCSGIISQCSQAQGCDCNGSNCEYVNCSTSDCVDWVVTNPTIVPGTEVPGSGVPAPSFTVQFVQLGIVPMSGGSGQFLDYQITITETGGNSGSWSVEGTPLGTGSSTTFKLSDNTNVQFNNVGFEVNFVGAAGQTGYIDIYNTNWFNIDNFVGDLFTTPAAWAYDVQGQAISPTFNGGSFTPGNLKLCVCGTDSKIIGYSWTTTEGNLTLTFTPLPDGCVRATAQGCGTGEGTVTIECAGIQTTLPLPSLPFDLSGANCCDPLTDPNCNGTPGDGFGCTEFTVVNGDLAVSNTNFVTGDGYGLFRGVFQPGSIGYSIPQWIHAARTVCWSVTGTVRETTTFAPPVIAHLFHDVEYRNGDGCLDFGKTCDIKIANCKKVEAEYCFVGCDQFSVNIVDTNPVFKASTSLGNNVQVGYAWSTNTTLTGTGSTFTIPTPNSTITTITVVATLNVNGNICVDSDTITLTLDAIFGCTKTTSCNFDATATVDDGTCIDIGNPSYQCALGFIPGVATGGGETAPVIIYKIAGDLLSTYDNLNPGTYTVDIYINGVAKCSKSLIVPQCYRCNSSICIPSPLNDNNGPYTTIDCDNRCSCDIEITVTPNCNNNQSYFVITATGDSGTYTGTVTKVAGSQFVAPTAFTDSSNLTTPLLCNGLYNIVVTGENCSNSVTWEANCFNCDDSLLNVSSPAYDQFTNVLQYTLTGDPCSNQYAVQIAKDGVDIVGLYDVVSTPGYKTLPFGFYRGDGVYTVKVVDNNGCLREVDFVLNVNNTLTCYITAGSTTLLAVPSGSDLSFVVTFETTNATGLYTIDLYNSPGPSNCSGAFIIGSPFASITNQPVIVGTNNVNFNGIIPAPSVQTCYGVRVRKQGVSSCFDDEFYSFIPDSAPGCAGSVTAGSYDEATGKVVASWLFTNTSNDLTVEVTAYPDVSCGTGTPVIVSTSSHGAGGSMVHVATIPQLKDQDQCTEIHIFDTNDPTCTDTLTFTIPGCTCSVEIVGTPTVDLDTNEITINVNTTCTTGNVDVFLTGDVTETQSILGSTTGLTENQDVIITLDPYPSTGGTTDIEVTDNIDGGCTITKTGVVLPENCVDCGQVATFYNSSSVVTLVKDSTATTIATGTYDVVTDEEALETAIQAGSVGQGANFCSGTEKIDVVSPREAGILVNMDNTDSIILDYANITNADWVGTKKVYFGNCGCDTGHLCDYTVVLSIAAADDTVTLYFGTNMSGQGYTSNISITGMTQTPSGSLLTTAESDILTALTTLSGCNFTVGSVSVTYDGGLDELTITVSGTDAALGVVQAINTGVGITTTLGFTQSGCV